MRNRNISWSNHSWFRWLRLLQSYVIEPVPPPTDDPAQTSLSPPNLFIETCITGVFIYFSTSNSLGIMETQLLLLTLCRGTFWIRVLFILSGFVPRSLAHVGLDLCRIWFCTTFPWLKHIFSF